MHNFVLILAAIVIGFIPCWVQANPVTENWTSTTISYDIHACGADRFVVEGGGDSSRGAFAKFTVFPGDTYLNTTGERSEVVLGGWESTSQFKVNGDEGVEFYRVSVKLSSDWIEPQVNNRGYAWGTFFQLHGPDEYGASPAVAIHAENNFSLFLLGGDMSKKRGAKWALTRSDLAVGKWVDFVLEIKWAPNASGAISVYRRDEGESIWEKVADIQSVATLQYMGESTSKPHYWKAGFYRSESQHVNSLWLGPIFRGRTFAEVTIQ